MPRTGASSHNCCTPISASPAATASPTGPFSTTTRFFSLPEIPRRSSSSQKYIPLAPTFECATESAESSVRTNASADPISGFAAPLRTASPMPELPRAQTCVTSPFLRSSSSASEVRIRRSARVPCARRSRIACVASKCSSSRPTMCSNAGCERSSTPFSASELSTTLAECASAMRLFGLDSRRLADLRELRDFALDVRGELLGRARVYFEALLCEAALDVRRAEGLHGLRVQAGDDRGRRARGREEAEPRQDLESRQPGFRHGRHLRQRWCALVGGDRERTHFGVPDLGPDVGHVREHVGHLAAEESGNGRGRALVRDMLDIDGRHRLEQLAAE